jgi:PST family polysaccharide transporter
VLGPEKFGLVNFANAFVAYFSVLTDFGFNFSATRDISINRDNPAKVESIFNAVMVVKLCLFVLSLLIFSVVVLTIPFFKNDGMIYIYSFGFVLGNLLFPIWFFQGLERMKYIAILNVTAKAMVTLIIFLLITKESDFELLVILNSLGFLLVGLCSLFIVKYKFKIKFYLPAFGEIKYQVKESWQLFISNVAINLYTISNTFILGIITNNTVVGYFSAADKIRLAAQGIFSTISQTVYPHVSYLFKQSISEGINFIKKLFYFIGSAGFVVSLLIFILAPAIVKLLLGDGYFNSVLVLRIIAFLPFIIVLSNIAGIQTMLNLNMKKAFTVIIVFASAINIILALVLVPAYKEIGTSVSMLLAEIFVSISMIISLMKRKVILSESKYV